MQWLIQQEWGRYHQTPALRWVDVLGVKQWVSGSFQISIHLNAKNRYTLNSICGFKLLFVHIYKFIQLEYTLLFSGTSVFLKMNMNCCWGRNNFLKLLLFQKLLFQVLPSFLNCSWWLLPQTYFQRCTLVFKWDIIIEMLFMVFHISIII